MTLTGPQRAALVVLGLDEQVAIEVIKQLDDRDLRRLAEAVADLDPLPQNELEPSLEQFEQQMSEPMMPRGGRDYVERLTSSAVGDERARMVFASPEKANYVEMLRQARAQNLADLLAEEHTQIAAAILSQLTRSQAAEVVLAMSDERQPEVLMRLAQLAEVPEQAVSVAAEALAEMLASSGGLQRRGGDQSFDGVAFAAALVNELPKDDGDRILEALEEAESELVPRIREAMFTFEDLSRLDARSFQQLMREISSDVLLISLKTASEPLREAFLGAVSKRAALSMREDLEMMPPKRLTEVEEAQREIVETTMQMAADGRLTLPGGGEEELV